MDQPPPPRPVPSYVAPPSPPPPSFAGKPAESDLLVNPTISQDRTLGATVIEESNLKSLDRELKNLSLKSDPNVPQPHPMPRIVPGPVRRGRSNMRSKRRSRRSSDGYSSRSGSSRRSRHRRSPLNARGKLRELEDEARLGAGPLRSPDATGTEDQGGSHIASLLQNASVINRMVRPLTTQEQDLVEHLQLNTESKDTDSSSTSSEDYPSYDEDSDDEDLENIAPSSTIVEDDHILESIEPKAEVVTALWNDARQYRILCAIDCTSDSPLDHHFSITYEDIPFKSKDGDIVSRHLSGHFPIKNVERYLKTTGKCDFIVYRVYSCDKSGQEAARYRSTVFPKVSDKRGYKEHIVITSERLAFSLSRAALCTPSETNILDLEDFMLNKIAMTAPYRFIYHHRTALANYAHTVSSTTGGKILALLHYVEAVAGKKHKRADELFSRGMTDLSSQKFLIRPEEVQLVSSKDGAHYAIARSSWTDVFGWNWAYDGNFFYRRSVLATKLYPNFLERKTIPIQDLDEYPIKYAPESIRQKLYERGQRFWALRFQSYISYTGWDFLHQENHVATRCVIDYQTYRRFHPDAEAFKMNFPQLNRDIFWNPTKLHPTSLSPKDSKPSREDFYLMPPNIHGFVIQDKKWVNLWVENVGEVSWNKEAFRRLVLPPKTKDLIKALVMVRASKQGKRQAVDLPIKRDDIIASKGNGLIVLLHGGPGTGKTLTAESVAELAEMPLYRVTCGDIGTNAEAVEKYLQTILYLGKTWNCVLLLDEADVFLEERTLSDLERNSLVSVFLRILEYYQGILILTSNRIGTFDEAFRSRMQLALHYPNLTPTSRRKIWQNFFDMLEEDEEDVDIDEIKLHIDELADMEMNGREIRNALNTAKQLALYQKETLTWDHVENTVKITGDFNRYLKNVHGHSDEQRAREEGIR